MVSACERYVIVYNGEVYSHEEMRVDLERAGHRFRGTSDTEVILEGCAEWGVEATARRSAPDVGDERRNYYRITDAGLRVASAEAQRLEALTRAARRGGLLPKVAK